MEAPFNRLLPIPKLSLPIHQRGLNLLKHYYCAQVLFIEVKLRQTNSSIFFVFLSLKCQVCLTFVMKIAKMPDIRQTLQISHSDVIFLFLVLHRILVFAFLNYSKFLKNPSKYFGGDNDCPSRKPCTRYDVTSDIRSNQISRSTARCVFGTVYLKMSQKIVTKQRKRKESFVSIAV